MLLPLSTDRPLKRTPWVNYALILANLAAWLITQHLMGDAMGRTPGLLAPRYQGGFSLESLFLRPDQPRLVQFLSYAFLHADGWHLGGNMVFLFVFGNSVEDRLGRLNYLLFYLCGAVFSGLGHVLTSSAPALGASGAVHLDGLVFSLVRGVVWVSLLTIGAWLQLWRKVVATQESGIVYGKLPARASGGEAPQLPFLPPMPEPEPVSKPAPPTNKPTPAAPVSKPAPAAPVSRVAPAAPVSRVAAKPPVPQRVDPRKPPNRKAA